jgi:tetratricopeptide (TPR) repeat protein
MAKAKPEYDYDVFISYSHRDRGWVHGQLLPRLKAARVGRRKMRVCIDTECFRPGYPVFDEMKRAVLTSAKTVVVLSPDYLDSGFADFEHILQRTVDLKERQYRAIPLKLKPCDIPEDISMLIYIDFTVAPPHDEPLERVIAAIKGELPKAPRKPAKPALPFNMAPALPPYYIPREGDLQRLRDNLRQGGALALTAVYGMGGVGKSVLAAAIAHDAEAQRSFPDGVLWAMLGPGASGASDADPHLAAWGQMLGIDLKPYLTQDARVSVLRAALQSRRCLLVIDDPWPKGAAAARVLRDVRGRDCCALVTTRYAEVAAKLDATAHAVDVLTAGEALALLQSRLRRGLGEGETQPAEELAQRLGYLPLALSLAAAQVNMRRGWEDLLAPLREQQPAADQLDFSDPETRDQSLRLTFDASYDCLSKGDQRRYRWLGAMAGQALFRAADAALLWDEKPVTAQKALQRLARCALLDALRDGGEFLYRQHLLLRQDARRRMDKEEWATAFGRHTEVCLDLVQQAKQSMEYRAVDEARAQVMTALRRARRGYSDEEGPSLGDRADSRRLVSSFGFGLYEYWLLRGLMGEWIEWAQEAISCCRVIGERRDEGAHLYSLGLAYASSGDVRNAITCYEKALAVAREVEHRRDEANVLNNLGLAYMALGLVEEAIGRYEQALAIEREIGDRRGEGRRLGNLGLAYAAQGRVADALGCYERALAIAREIGDPRSLGRALNGLGLAFADLGRVEEAIKYYEQALAIAEEIGDRRGKGTLLNNLAHQHNRSGHFMRALGLAQQALVISCEVGDREGEAICLNTLGEIYVNLGRIAEGVSWLSQGLDIFEQLDSPRARETRRKLEELEGHDRDADTDHTDS